MASEVESIELGPPRARLAGATGLPRPAWLVLPLLAACHLALASWIGLLSDDFMLLLQVREASLWDILTLEVGPAPFQASIWKIAPSLLPEAPYLVVHGYAALLHAFNTALAFRVLAGLGLGRWAWLGAAAFALHRPGNESVLQAVSVSETLLTSFALVALLAWRRRHVHARYGWLAALACGCAMLAKPSALGVPALLALHTLLLEKHDSLGARLRAAAPPLALASTLVGGLAINALLRPGTWDYYGEMSVEVAPLAALSRVGVSLFRVFALVYPPGPLAAAWTGAVVLGVAVLAFVLVRDPVFRFGLAWAAALLPGSLLVETVNASRYEYPAALGVVLVLGAGLRALATRARALRSLGHGMLGIWLLGNGALYAQDLVRLRQLGQPSRELRALLREHRVALLASGRVVIAGQPEPYRVHAAQLFRYDADADLEVVHADACPTGGEVPCIEWQRPVGRELDCEGGCLGFHEPGPAG